MSGIFAVQEFAIDPFLQYGSFGLLAFIVFWAIWKFFPAALEKHERIITKVAEDSKAAFEGVSEAFTIEAKECREERRDTVRILAELQKSIVALQGGEKK